MDEFVVTIPREPTFSVDGSMTKVISWPDPGFCETTSVLSSTVLTTPFIACVAACFVFGAVDLVCAVCAAGAMGFAMVVEAGGYDTSTVGEDAEQTLKDMGLRVTKKPMVDNSVANGEQNVSLPCLDPCNTG